MNLTLCAQCRGEYPDTSLIDGRCYACFNADRADELLTLEHERAQALSLASEMTLLATSLRAVATGTASSLEISDLLGSIDGFGELSVRGTLDWQLLRRHARLVTSRDAEQARVARGAVGSETTS